MKQTAYLLFRDLCRYLPGLAASFSASAVVAPVNFDFTASERLAVEDITTDDVQRLFNGMTGAKATKDKTRMVLNQILDAAVEDGLITKSPLRSKRVKITGKASQSTAPYTVEQMRYLVQHIGDIQDPADRAYLAIQALHPLRLEKVLGLQAADIDPENGAIHICRAVTHPTRNQPEIKDTKTRSSARTIGLSALAVPHLPQVKEGEFVFSGKRPRLIPRSGRCATVSSEI